MRPLLFLIYINEKDEGVEDQIIKFADGTSYIEPSRANKTLKLFRKIIYKIEQWSRKWQMSFNASKFKTMHYEYDDPTRLYKINGNEIEYSSQEKDLEVLIQVDLDWDDHVLM